MIAKSLDIVVLLKLLYVPQNITYAVLAKQLAMSASEVHAAVKRLIRSGLIEADGRQPRLAAIEEYLLHGIKYAFPSQRGELTRGMPTSYAAPPLVNKLGLMDKDVPPVWPDPNGKTRGYALEPLYTSVPKAAQQDLKLYEMLALVDALRDGRAREKSMAEVEIKRRLSERKP